MKAIETKEKKRTVTKVVTARLFGIKILTLTTEMPPSELDLLSIRNGTDETLL